MPGSSRSIVLGGLAGFAMGVMFMWIPLVGPALCCATLFGTGLLAVWHRVATSGTVLSSREGARMGAQAGLVAFVAATALLSISWLIAGRPNLATQLRNYGSAELGDLDPELVSAAAQALDRPGIVLGAVLVWVVLYTVLGMAGGAIGVGVFRRAQKPPGKDDA